MVYDGIATRSEETDGNKKTLVGWGFPNKVNPPRQAPFPVQRPKCRLTHFRSICQAHLKIFKNNTPIGGIFLFKEK